MIKAPSPDADVACRPERAAATLGQDARLGGRHALDPAASLATVVAAGETVSTNSRPEVLAADAMTAAQIGGDRYRVELDSADADQQTLLFWYPSVTAAEGGYIQSAVKIEGGVRGVNYFCRLATTISAGEGAAKERRPPSDGARLLSSAE